MQRTESPFLFYLGTHRPHWLSLAGVPLFVSYRGLRNRRSLPRAIAPWALDSGGFSELSLHGHWTISAREYAQAVQRCQRAIGKLDFAAIQDWMVEPDIRERTGLSVEEHQRRTVDSWLELTSLAPEVPWAPVLQGWTFGDYLEHAEMYDHADPSWRKARAVGIGSVCRRQHTIRAQALIEIFAAEGLPMHGFGFKTRGLNPRTLSSLRSADSLAWSFQARRQGAPGDRNSLEYALAWREKLTTQGGLPEQPSRTQDLEEQLGLF